MHHCIIPVCLLSLHCITAKQRPSFLSLSLPCLAVHATTQNHTRTLCLFLPSVSPPAQTLCAQTHNERSVTRRRTVLALYGTHPSLCLCGSTSYPARVARAISQSVSQPASRSKSGGGIGLWLTFVSLDSLELDPNWF